MTGRTREFRASWDSSCRSLFLHILIFIFRRFLFLDPSGRSHRRTVYRCPQRSTSDSLLTSDVHSALSLRVPFTSDSEISVSGEIPYTPFVFPGTCSTCDLCNYLRSVTRNPSRTTGTRYSQDVWMVRWVWTDYYYES